MRFPLLQQAYDLLKEVPEDQWIVSEFTDENSKCCAIGHLVRLKSTTPDDYSTPNCSDRMEMWSAGVRRESARALESLGAGYGDLAVVNNGDVPAYKQAGPKARVMAFLKDAISIKDEDNASLDA